MPLFSDVDVQNHTPITQYAINIFKPRILIPSSNHALQSTHADKLNHRDMNQLYQEEQAEYYNRKASQTDRRPLHANELVYVYNTLTKTRDKGKIMKIPNPNREPRMYIIEKDGKLYQRTREHLSPRPQFIKKHQIENSIQCLHLP